MTEPIPTLAAIGFDSQFESQVAALGGDLVPARIAIAHGESYIAWTERGPCKAVLGGQPRRMEGSHRSPSGRGLGGGELLGVPRRLRRRSPPRTSHLPGPSGVWQAPRTPGHRRQRRRGGDRQRLRRRKERARSTPHQRAARPALPGRRRAEPRPADPDREQDRSERRSPGGDRSVRANLSRGPGRFSPARSPGWGSRSWGRGFRPARRWP